MSKKNEPIGILGAGCSGLTAAYYLQKAGYTNVTVLEQNDRVGGQCCTIRYKGKSYELGAPLALPTYSNTIKIMEDLNVSNNGPVLYRGFYSPGGKKIQRVRRESTAEFKKQFERLPEILNDYPEIAKPGFQKLDPRLCQPFSSWCAENGVLLLEDLYRPHFTGFGYGATNDIAAAYVLKFLDLQSLGNFIKISHLITWVDGAQAFWEKLAEQIDVRLSSRVVRVERGDRILLSTEAELFEFDRLIITTPLDETPEYMDVTPEEQKLFAKIENNYFNAFAYRMDGMPKVSGYIPEHCTGGTEGHLMTWYYRWQESKMNDLIVVYTCSKEKMHIREARRIVEEDIAQMGGTIHSLYTYKTWKHFPHVGCQALRDGFHDKMEALQGKQHTYYAGEIMTFSNIEQCTTYSRYLVDTYFK